MAPIRSYTNWNTRSSDAEGPITPYRHYYFMCEGRNTEKWYFEKIIDIRKELSIHSRIDMIYLEKTEEHENLSDPKKLIEFANKQKNNGSVDFYHGLDKMIIVFDADVFETQRHDYSEVLALSNETNILAVTNPSFELFLLLHKENSVEEIVHPNETEIIQNNWVGTGTNKRRFVEDLFRKTYTMRPKTNENIANLAYDVRIAIDQERRLNNDITSCKGIITSNVGQVIQSIMDDQCNS